MLLVYGMPIIHFMLLSFLAVHFVFFFADRVTSLGSSTFAIVATEKPGKPGDGFVSSVRMGLLTFLPRALFHLGLPSPPPLLPLPTCGIIYNPRGIKYRRAQSTEIAPIPPARTARPRHLVNKSRWGARYTNTQTDWLTGIRELTQIVKESPLVTPTTHGLFQYFHRRYCCCHQQYGP